MLLLFVCLGLSILAAPQSVSAAEPAPPALVDQGAVPIGCNRPEHLHELRCTHLARYFLDYSLTDPQSLSLDLRIDSQLQYTIREEAISFFGTHILLVTVTPGPENPPHSPVPHLEFPGFLRIHGPKPRSSIYVDLNFTPLTVEESSHLGPRHLEWNPVDVLDYPEVRFTARSIQNQDGEASELVSFLKPLVPSLVYSDPIDLASIESIIPRRRRLSEHLRTLFSDLLAHYHSNEVPLAYSIRYVYRLSSEPGSPEASLPVVNVPLHDFAIPTDWSPGQSCAPDADDANAPEVCRVAASLRTWFEQVRPPETGARFQIDLRVAPPTLELRDIRIPLREIKVPSKPQIHALTR